MMQFGGNFTPHHASRRDHRSGTDPRPGKKCGSSANPNIIVDDDLRFSGALATNRSVKIVDYMFLRMEGYVRTCDDILTNRDAATATDVCVVTDAAKRSDGEADPALSELTRCCHDRAPSDLCAAAQSHAARTARIDNGPCTDRGQRPWVEIALVPDLYRPPTKHCSAKCDDPADKLDPSAEQLSIKERCRQVVVNCVVSARRSDNPLNQSHFLTDALIRRLRVKYTAL